MFRDNIDNNAFAHITTINGVEYKLLRHHDIATVKDGKDHDSVDVGMLKFCCRLIGQVPVSEEERMKIAQHLADHAKAFNLDISDLADPDVARKIININNPSLAENPITEPILDKEDAFPDDNLASSPSLPKGEEPNLDRPKDTRAGLDQDVNISAPDTTTTQEGKVVVNAGPLDQGLQIHKDDEDKAVPADILTDPGVQNNPGAQGEPTTKTKDNDPVQHSKEELVGQPIIVKVGQKVGVALMDDFNVVTANWDNEKLTFHPGEYLIIAKLNVDPKEEANVCVIGDPPLLKEEDGRAAEPDRIYITQKDITPTGKDTILSVLRKGFRGQVKCSYQGTEKHGQIDYVTVKVGDEDYPFHIMLEVYRDADGNAMAIKLWNESLPADVLNDFADFLKKLTKGKE